MRLTPVVSILALLLGTTLLGYAGFTVLVHSMDDGNVSVEEDCQMYQLNVTEDPDLTTVSQTIPYDELSSDDEKWFQIARNNSPALTSEPVFHNGTTVVRYNESLYGIERTPTNQSCPTPATDDEIAFTAVLALFGGVFFIGVGAFGIIRYYHTST